MGGGAHAIVDPLGSGDIAVMSTALSAAGELDILDLHRMSPGEDLVISRWVQLK